MIILSVGRWFERSDNLDDLNYFVIIILCWGVLWYCVVVLGVVVLMGIVIIFYG